VRSLFWNAWNFANLNLSTRACNGVIPAVTEMVILGSFMRMPPIDYVLLITILSLNLFKFKWCDVFIKTHTTTIRFLSHTFQSSESYWEGGGVYPYWIILMVAVIHSSETLGFLLSTLYPSSTSKLEFVSLKKMSSLR